MIVRPHQTWVDSAMTEATVFGIDPTDRFAVMGGNMHSLWGYVHFRANHLKSSCVGVEKINLDNLRAISQARVSVIYGVPDLVATMLRLCKRHSIQLPSVRMILLGGGAVLPHFPVDHLGSICPMAKAFRFYGTAETSFIGHAPLQGYYTAFPGVHIDIDQDQVIWVKSALTTSPHEWISTGDIGRWVTDQIFDVLGRKSRQIQVKGQKYSVEPVEQALVRAFELPHLAMVQDDDGRVHCVIASDESTPSLSQINQEIRAFDPKIPSVRSLLVLPLLRWPLSQSGKTDFSVLQQLLQGEI